MPQSTSVNRSAPVGGLLSIAAPSNPSRDDESSEPSSFEQMLQKNASKESEPSDDEDKKVDHSKKAKRTEKPKSIAKKTTTPVKTDATKSAATAPQTNEPAEGDAKPTDEPTDAVATVELPETAEKAKPEQPAAKTDGEAEAEAAAVVAEPDPHANVEPKKEKPDETAPVKAAEVDPQAKPVAQKQTAKVQDASNKPKQPVDDAEAIEIPAEESQQSPPTTEQPKTEPPRDSEDSSKAAVRKPARLVEALAPEPVAVKQSASAHNNASSNGQLPGQTMKDASEMLDDWSDDVQSFGFDDADAAKPAAPVHANVDASLSIPIAAPLTTPTHATIIAPAPVGAPPPEVRFAADNHQQIVSAVRGNLLPNGGTMSIRLDPPELGDLQLIVHMRDGVMSAAFQTSNDQATHALSHSLGDLRTALEASGISVDRLHVEQAPRDARSHNERQDGQPQQQNQAQDSPARRDQQRRELLQRMWKRLSEGSDPLDMVA